MSKQSQKTFNLTKIIEEGKREEHIKLIDEQISYLDSNENFDKRHDIITLEIDDCGYSMKRSNLVSTLILLKPFVDFKTIPDDDLILFDFNRDRNVLLVVKVLDDYFNNVINELTSDIELLNSSFNYIIKMLSKVSSLFNYRIGNSISIWTFYNLIRNVLDEETAQELIDLLHTQIDLNDRKQVKEIGEDLEARNQRLLTILRENESHFTNFLKSETGINYEQFKQCFINCGFKPDIDDSIIEEPINSNYLVGLKTIQDFFTSAKGTRKALITNFKKVKDSGYLTRKLSLLTIDTLVDNDLDDCGTVNYIRCVVGSKKSLTRLNGRIYYDVNDNAEYLIEEDDTDLIGSTIALRSPITCAGKRICTRCYGPQLSEVNKKRHAGTLGILYLTSILTQMLLSSKHLLRAVVNQIDFGDVFDKYFAFDRNSILVNDEEIHSNNYIVINISDLVEDETSNETSFFIEKLTIRDKDENSEEIVFPLPITVSSSFLELLEDNLEGSEYILPIKDIPYDMVLFTMVINNIGLSTSLQSILDLIEKTDHLGLKDINDIYNKFIELLDVNNIKLNSVHIELILRNLIRDAENVYTRPDFTREINLDDYTVLRVKDANIKSESITVSLAFEEIEGQLINPDSYRKTGSSIMDPIFIR